MSPGIVNDEDIPDAMLHNDVSDGISNGIFRNGEKDGENHVIIVGAGPAGLMLA